jgi:hypothetical protein
VSPFDGDRDHWFRRATAAESQLRAITAQLGWMADGRPLEHAVSALIRQAQTLGDDVTRLQARVRELEGTLAEVPEVVPDWFTRGT